MANKNGSSKVAVPYAPTVIFVWMGGNVHLKFNVKDETELLGVLKFHAFGEGEVVSGNIDDLPYNHMGILSDIQAFYYAPGAVNQTKLVLKKGTKRSATTSPVKAARRPSAVERRRQKLYATER